MGYSEKAEALSMGNGSVSSFADAVSNSVCNKGLFAYTTNMGYRVANIMNGYNISDGGRYHYRGAGTEGGDIAPTIAYYYDRGLIRHTVTIGNQIGESYSHDFTGNGNKFFVSPYEFTLFESLLRSMQLARTDSDRLNRDKYGKDKFVGEDYSYKATGVQQMHSTVDGELLGEQYLVPIESIRPSYHLTLSELNDRFLTAAKNRTWVVKEKTGRSVAYNRYLTEYATANMEYRNSPTDGEEDRQFRFLKSMDAVASERRERLQNYSEREYNSIDSENLSTDNYSLIQNFFGDEYGSQYFTPNEGTLNLKTYFSGDVTDITEGGGTGLYEYSATWRKKYQVKRTGPSYLPEGFYNQQNPYGINGTDPNNDTFERYSINDGDYTTESTIPVSAAFTDGSLISNGGSTRAYNYYNEEGNAVNGDSTFTTDNSSVNVLPTDSGSRLMQKTNKLFGEATIHSLINRFHTDALTGTDDALISSYSSYGLSRGRNLLKESGSETSLGYDNPYCRVWTAAHQYSRQKDRIRAFMEDENKFMKLSNLQKNLYDSYRPNNGAERLGANSVLKDNGYVRITPMHDDRGVSNNIKNYMFSIENLAWRDVIERANNSLSKEQIGPNGGRIMWFPPYGLSFTENVSAEWNTNRFIGRGEDIYTYVNTRRSGTLNFTLLIDHPSIINQWRGMGDINTEKEKREQELLRFFAGCGTLSGSLSGESNESEETTIAEAASIETKPTTETKDVAYVVFFANDFSAVDYGKSSVDEVIEKLKLYETQKSNEPFEERDKTYLNEMLRIENYENYNRYGLNIDGGGKESIIRKTLFSNNENIEIRYLVGDTEKNGLIDIAKDITANTKFGLSGATCKIKSVKIKGFASSHGKAENNEELCRRRRQVLKRILIGKSPAMAEEIIRFDDGTSGIISMDENNTNVNSLEAKIARAATAIISVECDATSSLEHGSEVNGRSTNGVAINNANAGTEESGDVVGTNVASTTVTIGDDDYAYDNEYKYFSELKEDSPLVFKALTEKIRYFNPAFHSITPEGFNARLTFLHQCTRQGPTYAVSNGDVNQSSDELIKYAGNLAFGRAPYCILRIGDFFNTKICITSISINYNNGGNVSWDLNPEGTGVQPMMAAVTVNFNFIGGQDIAGPIERLQNAVTANYYANASIYDRHADVAGSHYFDAWNGTQEAIALE